MSRLQYVVLLFLVMLASTIMRNQAIPGDWNPIKNIDDPHVTEIAIYAVTEHDLQTDSKLELEKVINGETKIVDGIIYCLNITAKDNSGSNKYNIAVLERKSAGNEPVTKETRIEDKKAKIGVCVSKPKGLRRASSSEVVVYSEPPPPAESKSLFKPKPRTPSDIVRNTRDLLRILLNSPDNKRDNDKMIELFKNLRELKTILYGNSEAEPVPEACSQLTQEFFNDNTLRLLVQCLPKLNLEARKDATQVVANLQRQQVQSRLIASDYLENNMDLMDILISSYENQEMALHYGTMLRECIRHQIVAKYVLESPHMKKFFDYIQLPNFDIAADAAATFKELMTRHKSTVAEFLSKNYEWFFDEYNTKLLESSNYITRRQAVKLLGDMLLDRSNAAVMTRYVSSRENLRILMNLMRESSKSIQIEAFHVFKLFAANQRKPPDIIGILVANRSKLLRLLGELKLDKEDEQFEADKAQVMKEVAALEPRE